MRRPGYEGAGFDHLVRWGHEEVDAIRAAKGLPSWKWEREAMSTQAAVPGHKADESVTQSVAYEQCKFGRVKAGVCLTEGCREKRSHLDTTGFCRKCKIAKGMVVSAPYVSKRPPAPTLAAPSPAPMANSNSCVTVSADFLQKVWDALPRETQVAVLASMFRGLPILQKQRWVEAALSLELNHETATEAAAEGGAR